MHLPARTVALLVFAASCGIAPGQLPVPRQIEIRPAAPAGQQAQRSADEPTPQGAPAAEVGQQPQPEEPKGPPPTKEELDGLTEHLSSDDFKTRESTQLELTRLAKQHPEVAMDPILGKYLSESTVPEARYRLRAILYGSYQAVFKSVPRGFVGIVMNPTFARGDAGQMIHAIQVARVVPGSAAEKFGLQLMDQITSIDDKSFDSTEATTDFANYVSEKKSGDKVVLSVLRNGQAQKIPMTLGERPPDLYDYRFQERLESDFKAWLDENTARLRAKK